MARKARKSPRPKRTVRTYSEKEYDAGCRQQYENGLEAGKLTRTNEIKRLLGIQDCRFTGMTGMPMPPMGWYR